MAIYSENLKKLSSYIEEDDNMKTDIMPNIEKIIKTIEVQPFKTIL